MSTEDRHPIQVVPHFMRLHEWIALEEGHFDDEGLEPDVLDDVMHAVSGHRGDPYGSRPQDLPFVQHAAVANGLRLGLGVQRRRRDGPLRAGPLRRRPLRVLRHAGLRHRAPERPA
jgi:hypothetical protein